MGSLLLNAKYADNLEQIVRHFHDCHQILYITEGSVKVTVNNQSYYANAGTMILISRFEQHAVQIESKRYSRYTLQISPKQSESSPFQPLLSVLVNRPGNFCHTFDLPGIENHFKRIMAEWNIKDGTMHEAMLDLMLYELLILMCRARPRLIPNENRMNHTVAQIQQYLNENYQTRITLDALSKMYHLSQSYLCHQFKLLTGQSVMGYLTSCRLAAAKQQLSHSSDPITKVTIDCGFSDCSNFSRMFKEYTGYTPTDFRIKFGK